MIAITDELYWLIGLGMIGNMVIAIAILLRLNKIERLLKLDKEGKDDEHT